jgi:hypothetical protein
MEPRQASRRSAQAAIQFFGDLDEDDDPVGAQVGEEDEEEEDEEYEEPGYAGVPFSSARTAAAPRQVSLAA